MVELVTAKKDAGKTHYAKERVKELIASGINAMRIDGDEYREEKNNDDFSSVGREKNLMEAAQFAAEMEQRGYYVVMAFIAPKREWRDKMRSLWKESRVVYLPGGTLWPEDHPGYTEYEEPSEEEFSVMYNVKYEKPWQGQTQRM